MMLANKQDFKQKPSRTLTVTKERPKGRDDTSSGSGYLLEGRNIAS